MRFPTLILLLATAATAQQSGLPPAARLEGIVRSTSGEPLPRATLTLEGRDDDERPALIASSDDQGRFRFEQVPPGSDYFLTARRPGFAEARYGARAGTEAGTPLTLDRGAVINDIVIAMTAQGLITGRVTDPAGDPVVSAPVIALRPVYERGQRRIAMAGRASTDDLGEYRIANLAPGTYYVSVADRRILNTGPGHPKEAFALTYFPNGGDIRGATPLRVAGGSEVHAIDIRLRRERVYAIRGRVLDAKGVAANGTLVAAVPVDQAIAGVSAINGPNGGGMQPARLPDASFEFGGLTPGSYLIQTLPGVRLNGSLTPALVARLEVTITDQDVSGAVLVAGAGATVSGTVKIEGAGIRELMASVSLEEASPLAVNTSVDDEVAVDGTFQIKGAAPGRHFVGVTGLPGNVYVKSVRFNGEDVTHTAIDLSSGAGGRLEIVLSPKAAGIIGIVRGAGGQALGAVPVTLWSATPDAGSADQGIRMQLSDQNGAFQFSGLPPGEYFLAAWDGADSGLLQNRNFLTAFVSDAAQVKLAEGGHGAIEATLIPAEKIKAAEEQLP